MGSARLGCPVGSVAVRGPFPASGVRVGPPPPGRSDCSVGSPGRSPATLDQVSLALLIDSLRPMVPFLGVPLDAAPLRIS